MTDKKLPFMDHVNELRNRIRISLMVFIIAFFGAYFLSDKILKILQNHFLGKFMGEEFKIAILAETVVSGFVTQINLSLLLAATISLPVLIYEMFLFIEPALNKKFKWIAIKIVLSASILFVLGAAFIYFIMLPLLFEFFVESNASLGLSNFFSVESFFEFIIVNMFVGGLMFQMPLIITIANRVGILPKRWLTSSRRIVYIGILIIAGIVTPDHSIISQLILGGVMALLFEISLIFSR